MCLSVYIVRIRSDGCRVSLGNTATRVASKMTKVAPVATSMSRCINLWRILSINNYVLSQMATTGEPLVAIGEKILQLQVKKSKSII